VVFYFLLLEIVQYRNAKGASIPLWSVFVVSALFTAHPIHTEVVANIKGRDEIMTLFFSLAATLFVWRAVDRRSWPLAFGGAALFFLGLLSKENAITFLAVVPILLYLLRKDFKWNQLIYYFTPVVAVAAIFIFIRSSVIGGGSAKVVPELMNNPFLKLEAGR